MSVKQVLPFIVGLMLLPLGSAVQAQATPMAATTASPSRAQVKQERDAFLKLNRWDQQKGDWVLKSGAAPPPSSLTRADAMAARDLYLANNRWDPQVGWVPITPAPRVLSRLSRAQVQMETREFMRMNRFNEASATWEPRSVGRGMGSPMQ